ncbi:MAG TPA: hypothetical protein P5102_15080 [Candidatus Competibacteraceae bacterium]|nr:hypothetical protein [Candidatus Competibacteraceae bacterium]
MKFLRFCSVALVLLLSAVMAHAQGFQDSSFPKGPGKPELKYHLLVPEGVTITNKKGEVVKGGQVVLVPGANVTILESAYVKTQMENPEFKAGFVNAENYIGMPEERVRDYAIVSIKVPEGVTVERGNRKITGPSQVTIMVTNKGSATADTTPAESWNTMGGFSGWNK